MSEFLDRMKRQLPSDEDSFKRLLDFAIKLDSRVKEGTGIIKSLEQQNAKLVEVLNEMIECFALNTSAFDYSGQVVEEVQQTLAEVKGV
jgi:hypothetical protein